MSPSLRSLVVTAVVAALASGLATWASVSWIHRDRTPPSLHAMIHDQIALTPEQDRRIETLEAAFAQDRDRLEGELRTANREMVAAISANQGDTPEVQTAVDHFHDAMGDLQKATLGHVFEMRAELTPEQARAFDAAVIESLQAGSD
ncbi:MAG: periplasmic heavy metal sensor [Caulobacterales bacterium]|nr:periplasmic heavy metal sensor [Caulobacterales bacterium]